MRRDDGALWARSLNFVTKMVNFSDFVFIFIFNFNDKFLRAVHELRNGRIKESERSIQILEILWGRKSTRDLEKLTYVVYTVYNI